MRILLCNYVRFSLVSTHTETFLSQSNVSTRCNVIQMFTGLNNFSCCRPTIIMKYSFMRQENKFLTESPFCESMKIINLVRGWILLHPCASQSYVGPLGHDLCSLQHCPRAWYLMARHKRCCFCSKSETRWNRLELSPQETTKSLQKRKTNVYISKFSVPIDLI